MHADWLAARDRLVSALGQGTTSAIIGPRGTGKTQLAVAAARAVAKLEKERDWQARAPIVYTTAMDLFLELREAVRLVGSSERATLKRFAEPALLIIDEIQERGGTEWEDRNLVCIVDRRYRDGWDTLLIGNLKPAELAQQLGASIMSRLRETGEVIECAWSSFRERRP